MQLKILCTFGIGLVLSPFGAFADVPMSAFGAFEIDPAFLKEKLSEFSGDSEFEMDGINYRITERGSREGRELARRYLQKQYEGLGFTVSRHAFSAGVTGENLIAEIPGEDPSKVLILSAHLDSVGNPGADDDGSGTITVLSIAREIVRLVYLENLTLKHSLRILAFDMEETGLDGSRAYVRSLKKANQLSQIMGVLNIEMTGYDPNQDGSFHVIDCDREESVPFRNRLMSAVAAFQIPLIRTEACTDRSDHASFWTENVPALVIAANFFGGEVVPCPEGMECGYKAPEPNPCYHQSCDRVDILDFNYMAQIAKASVLTAASLILEQ